MLALTRARDLSALWLELPFVPMGDDLAQCLGSLGALPRLTILRLELPHTNITSTGCSDLARLALAPSLHTLAPSLHTLAPSLHTLYLNLAHCRVCQEGVDALAAALQKSQGLGCLALGLRAMRAWKGLQEPQLGLLRHASALHTLRLDLSGNPLTRDGTCREIAALRASPVLRCLSVNFFEDGVGDDGAVAPATLAQAPALRTLRLNLMNNRVTAKGARSLAQLTASPGLRTLRLNLRDNTGDCNGASAEGALKDALAAPAQHRRCVDLPPPVRLGMRQTGGAVFGRSGAGIAWATVAWVAWATVACVRAGRHGGCPMDATALALVSHLWLALCRAVALCILPRIFNDVPVAWCWGVRIRRHTCRECGWAWHGLALATEN